MNAVADKLREARALIERGWTQGWFARNAKGNKVSARVTGRTATCFCAYGALIRATGRDEYDIDYAPETHALRRVLGHDIDGWNDAPERTQAEVLAAFDKAIELAEQSLWTRPYIPFRAVRRRA